MRRFLPLFALVFAVLVSARGADDQPLFRDPSQPVEARVRDLVARMTLEEKAVSLMNTTPGVPRLGIPKYDWWNEALHGVARAGEATVFPQAIGLAAMWDEPLMHEIASVIGVEARAKFNGAGENAGKRYYGLTFWSPNINIFRDPRWGRGQETYGEDPFLTARLGLAFVRGLQGDHPTYLQAAACAKHFAVHSGPEPLRHVFDVSPSEQDLYETYLPAFETLVRDADVEIVMTAYNALYGQPCPLSPLLFGLLEKWRFDGHVTSDCGSIADLSRTYKIARDDAEAEALALKAGVNVRCGDDPPAVVEAVKRGLISEEMVDRRLAQLLRTMFRLGFFDPADKVPYSKIPFAANNSPAHAALAERAAVKSMVLLKNDGVLPLDRARLRRVAVIGPNAASETVLLGNYNGKPSAPVTALAGLRAALGAGVTIDYVRGCDYATLPGGVRPIPRTGLRFGEYTGLMGEYFANSDLTGKPVAQRRDRPIDIDVAGGKMKLPTGVPEMGISARWKGELLTTLAGEYRLVIAARGGVRLKIGDETVIDDWAAEDRTRSVVRKLPENAALPVTLEYRQGEGPARISLQWELPAADAGYAEAVAAAEKADAILFVGGISAQLEGEEMTVDYEGFEGGDRTAIELPGVQQALLEKLKATGKPLVCVLMSGSALAVPWLEENANAILHAWYPGQAGGTAIADILLGKANPSGRLPVTFYRETADLPPFADYSMENRTYRYFRGKPLYSFGHGLSYTRFSYDRLRAAPASGTWGVLAVAVDVRNTGERAGEEVVQVYVTPPDAREVQALGAFHRVTLQPGEQQTVTVNVPTLALRRWNAARKDYHIPEGEWTVRVGASAADIRQTVKVKL